jgi:hypothetical protein
MTKPRLAIGVALALFLMIAGASLYEYESDKAAWDTVQAKLIRLDSGLQYESILAIRSQIADTDAAVRMFASEPHAFPPDRMQRVQYSKKAIAYLALATDLQINGASDTELSSSSADLERLAQFPDVTTFVRRSCEFGYLAFDRKGAAAASAQLGHFMLSRAEGEPLASGDALSPKGNYAALDITMESGACSSKARHP